MRKSWIDLYNGTASYESDVVNATSDFDFFVEDIETSYKDNDGEVLVEMRVSLNDGLTWGDWIVVNRGHKPLFDGEEVPLKYVKYQYRVLMSMFSIGGITPVFNSFKISLSGAYKIINSGDVVCKPEIWIRKKSNSGDVELRNETNNTTMEFKDLAKDEEVYIDCENEDIVSSLPQTYRYTNHNGVFFELEVGENIISGSGDFELDMRLEFKTKQG